MLRRGPAAEVIAALALDAAGVFWNEIAIAPHQAVAHGVAAAVAEIGSPSQSFRGDLLVSPMDIRSKEGRGLRVFTPFWKRLQNLGDLPKPVPPPGTLKPANDVAGESLEHWQLEPTRPDWAGGLRET